MSGARVELWATRSAKQQATPASDQVTSGSLPAEPEDQAKVPAILWLLIPHGRLSGSGLRFVLQCVRASPAKDDALLTLSVASPKPSLPLADCPRQGGPSEVPEQSAPGSRGPGAGSYWKAPGPAMRVTLNRRQTRRQSPASASSWHPTPAEQPGATGRGGLAQAGPMVVPLSRLPKNNCS